MLLAAMDVIILLYHFLLTNVLNTGVALGAAVNCFAVFHLRRHRNAGI